MPFVFSFLWTCAVFDDSGPRPVQACCSSAPYAGKFQPMESLSAAFAGQPAAGVWTLGVLDATVDGSVGNLSSWSLNLVTSPCGKGGTPGASGADAARNWVLQTATGAVPAARYHHLTLTIGPSVFVIGGQGASGLSLATELHRLVLQAKHNACVPCV